MTTLTSADRYLYASRLLGYLGRHADSVELLTEAITHHPEDVRLWRQRGHRRITTRDFGNARDDLERASTMIVGTPDEHEWYQPEVVQDVLNIVLDREDQIADQHQIVDPSAMDHMAGMYKSTLHGSVWYHLALAKYLLGDFAGAAQDFATTVSVTVDDDLAVAAVDWQYMSLRRAGMDSEAAELLSTIDPASFTILPEHDFYLRRLKLYTGELQPQELFDAHGGSILAEATQGYGVGNWYYYNGEFDKAREAYQWVLDNGFENAFGYMAAELDLNRLDAP